MQHQYCHRHSRVIVVFAKMHRPFSSQPSLLFEKAPLSSMPYGAVAWNSESKSMHHSIIAEALATPLLPINVAIASATNSSIMGPHPTRIHAASCFWNSSRVVGCNGVRQQSAGDP